MERHSPGSQRAPQREREVDVIHVLSAVVEKYQGGWQGHQEGHHTGGYCTGVEACRVNTSLSDAKFLGAPGITCKGQEGMAGSLWLEHQVHGTLMFNAYRASCLYS